MKHLLIRLEKVILKRRRQTRYLRISWRCGFSNNNRLIGCEITNTSDKTIRTGSSEPLLIDFMINIEISCAFSVQY